jgi:hypothetical protein
VRLPVTTTTWTCARCGFVEYVDGIGQPKNWSRFSFATPPMSSEPQPVADLCNPCGGYAVTFLLGGDVAAEEARDAEVRAMEARLGGAA